ncbi:MULTISPECIES: serine hydrolase domain-containing protein [unclassified Streptomyces]|uniref:serine hydrolase domain-containing protein n=1 Tax=unclassified Streptomyces TaxID=2593676 RepID=UPI003827D5DD
MTPDIGEPGTTEHPAPDTPASVDGTYTARFGPVALALRRIADAEPHAGFAVAAYLDGRPVVDLWAGHAHRESLFHTWSTVKPVIGTCLLLLLHRTGVSPDCSVRAVWPELRAAHDPELRIRHLLAHAAGLVSVPGSGVVADLIDWDATVDRLSAATPDWRPGRAVGEHALTYGHVTGELIRRLDGRSPGRFLAEELSGPLGLDLRIGAGPAETHRIADTQNLDTAYWERYRGHDVPLRRSALGSGMDGDLVNSAAWRSAQIPAVNGHASARGLAAFYARMLEGALPAAATRPGARGTDRILGRPVVWSLAGGQLRDGQIAMGGAGGQWAAAHPESGLAWAFLTSGMGNLQRAAVLERTLFDCVGATAGRATLTP